MHINVVAQINSVFYKSFITFCHSIARPHLSVSVLVAMALLWVADWSCRSAQLWSESCVHVS